MGGLVGALAANADVVIEGMVDAEREIARRILLSLVNADRTRRSAEKSTLEHTHGPLAPAVLARLIDARLLTVTGREGSAPIVELVHEALILRWKSFGRWLDEDRGQQALLNQLEDAAQLWQRRGKSEGTWEASVEETSARLGARLESASPLAREFLHASAEKAEQRRRFRRRAAWGGVLSLVVIAAASIIALVVFRLQSEQLVLATADVGLFELELVPFEQDPATGEPIYQPRSLLPKLSWSLYAPDPESPELPGAALRIVSTAPADRPDVVRVEARSGAAHLRVDGRSADQKTCGPSWVPLRALPGYGDRAKETQRLVIYVPTCGATLDGMIEIPAGPYFSGGPGDPPLANPKAIRAESVRALPAFFIDAMEVSNARFAIFAKLERVTGLRGPGYPSTKLLALAGRPEHPVTGVDWATAGAYCRFLGKRLPDSEEWEKAARGGQYLDADRRIPNPLPRRPFPWGAGKAAINVAGGGDGFEATAPVESFAEARSPYGLWNMAGNVDEWTGTLSSLGGRMRVIRGGSWFSPPELEHYGVSYENARDPRHSEYSLGVRCVYDRTD
jgi:formylglycine-generating enzyme required for sulfatase activity